MGLIGACFWALQVTGALSLLYPTDTETREKKELNGLWLFKISPSDNEFAGFSQEWYKTPFEQLGDFHEMPVPSSYNDVTTNRTIRDFLGVVWYQRSVFIPASWKESRVFCFFGGVHYSAQVWVNGKFSGSHVGGHIPFQIEVSQEILYGTNNLMTVAINNTLTNLTIPQGFLTTPNDTYRYPPGSKVYRHDFDYFDYAGLNREVILFKAPKASIHNIIIDTEAVGTTGYIRFKVVSRNTASFSCYISLKHPNVPAIIAKSSSCSDRLVITKARFWWPVYTKGKQPGFMYTLSVVLESGDDVDVYHLPVGIRSLSWSSNALYINGEEVYLRGFGMHEDSEIRGRGTDWVQLMRDISLLQWTGANALRTSHYPYSLPFIQQADKLGYLVILESPACSLSNFDQQMLERHMEVMEEIISIYRNHPSVILWSLANEPNSDHPMSDAYFGNLTMFTKSVDNTRPVMFVTSQQIYNEKAIQHVDIIGVNRYSGWYQDPGHLDLIPYQMKSEIEAWHSKYRKPIILTEYGAGSLPGFHKLPSTMWTEDYQSELFENFFGTFDELRKNRSLSGEMIWNFADFNTPQEFSRPGYCAKGIFTRNRQPKSAAYLVRKRYESLKN